MNTPTNVIDDMEVLEFGDIDISNVEKFKYLLFLIKTMYNKKNYNILRREH